MKVTAERYFVAFDVDAIKDYVFAAVRPLDITGASRIVEGFTQEAASLRGVVYAGGGNGVLVARSAAEAAQRSEWLETRFAELTGHAGSCTAVAVPGHDFQAARRLLWRAVTRRKAMRGLDEPSRLLLPAGVPACQACGREPGDVELKGRDEPNDEQRIGRQCELRRRAGRAARSATGQAEPAPARELGELFGADERDRDRDSEPAGRRGSMLAAVYLDADRAGERLQALASMGEVKAFADSVRSVTRSALHAAVRTLGLDGKFIAPVVGGDDVLVFIDARQAAAMLRELWKRLRPLEQRWELRFSGAVAVGPARAPLRLLLRQVEADLRASKQAAATVTAARVTAAGAAGPGVTGADPTAAGGARRQEPAVTVTSLSGGRLHDPRRPLFGGPVPQSLWTGSPSVTELIAALGSVPPAQRAGMAEDLAQPSAELVDLDLQYRAVAGSASGRSADGQRPREESPVQRALHAGRTLAVALRAAVPQTSLADVLRGGLIAAEWWG